MGSETVEARRPLSIRCDQVRKQGPGDTSGHFGHQNEASDKAAVCRTIRASLERISRGPVAHVDRREGRQVF